MSQEEGDVEVMSDVELSSDEEEEDDDEVSLIVLKRPDLKKRVVQDVEVCGGKMTYYTNVGKCCQVSILCLQ